MMRSTRDSMLPIDANSPFTLAIPLMAENEDCAIGPVALLLSGKLNQSKLYALAEAYSVGASAGIVVISVLLACIGLSMFWLLMLLIG